MVTFSNDSAAKKFERILTSFVGYGPVFTLGSDINREVRKDMGKHTLARPQFTINVTTNFGRNLDVVVTVNDTFYRSELFSFDCGKYNHKTNTVQVGRKRRNEDAEVFSISIDDLYNSEAYKKVKAEYNSRCDEIERNVRFEVERRCEVEFGNMIAKYDASLVSLVHMSNEEIKNYFLDNGWEIEDGIDFSEFQFGGWILTSRPDGYGHHCGLAVNVDYVNKKINTYTWSSDD